MLLNRSEYPEMIVEDASVYNLVVYIRNLWLDAEFRVDTITGLCMCICNVYGRKTEGAVHTAVTVIA